MNLTADDFARITRYVESFLFGLYTGIFAAYWQFHIYKDSDETKKFNLKQNIIFYGVCILFVFSMAVIALDIAISVIVQSSSADTVMVMYCMQTSQIVLFGCCDFIAQSILIYRCWIVWGRDIRVVVIPSILAFAFLVMWSISVGVSFTIVPSPSHGAEFKEVFWGKVLGLTSLAVSMAVNALVTSLILFRILKVYRQLKNNTTSEEKSLGITSHGRQLRFVIFIIIESGMALFAVQLSRFALAILPTSADPEQGVYLIISSIHEMLNGITPTIILVWVSMRLSFHDQPSLKESVGSLRFGPGNPNGVGSTTSQDSLYIGPDDPISIRHIDDDIAKSDEIQIVDM